MSDERESEERREAVPSTQDATMDRTRSVAGQPSPALEPVPCGAPTLSLDAAPLDRPSPPASSHSVGSPPQQRFTILRSHARGGLGEVSLARDEQLGRSVALKEIRRDFLHEATAVDRFRAEARITGQLEHPGIVPVYALDEDAQGRPYYAMRFIQGRTLGQAISEYHRAPTPLARTTLLHAFVTVCQTVAYAHSKSIVHRDLKPSNILLGDYGETLTIDWGLAKRMSSGPEAIMDPASGERELHGPNTQTPLPASAGGLPSKSVSEQETGEADGETEVVMRGGTGNGTGGKAGSAAKESFAAQNEPSEPAAVNSAAHRDVSTASLDLDITVPGAILGTPAYMSPEQAAGDAHRVGPSSDVYSLGAILYEILAGVPPFRADSVERLLEQVRGGTPPPLSRYQRGTPRPLEAICRKAMARDISARYDSALDLASDVERFLADEPVRAYREGWPARVARWVRRHPALVGTAGAGLATATMALLVGLAAVNAERRNTAAALVKVTEAEGRTRAALVAERQAKEAAFAAQKVEAAAKQQAREALAVTTDDAIERLLARQGPLDDADRAFLQRVLQFHEQFVQETGDTRDARAFVANAYMRVGSIRQKLNDIQGAETALIQAVDKFRDLTAEAADQAEHQGLLAQSAYTLANVLRDQRKINEAVARYEEAIAAAGRAVELSPREPAYRHMQARCFNSLGILYDSTGRSGQAEQPFRQALQIRQQLADENPDRIDYLSELASSHNNLGMFYRGQRRIDDCVQATQTAIALQRRLLEQDADNPNYLRELAGSLQNLGVNLVLAGQAAEAVPPLRESIVTFARLAAEYPGIPSYRQHLLASYLSLGQLLTDENQLVDAESLMKEAAIASEKLVAEFPNVPTNRRLLGGTLQSLGELQQKLGYFEQASLSYQQAERTFAGLVEDYRDVPVYRLDLLNVYDHLSRLKYESGDCAGAEQVMNAALAIVDPLRNDPRLSTTLSEQLVTLYVRLGHCLRFQNRPEEAVVAYETAWELTDSILQKELTNSEARKNELLVRVTWGSALRRARQLGAAEEVLRDAVQRARAMSDQQPEEFRNLLATALDAQGILLREQRDLEQAMESFRETREIRAAAVAAAPDNGELRNDLAGTLGNLAACLLDQNDVPAARQLLEESLMHSEVALAQTARHPLYGRFYRDNLLALADAQLRTHDHQAAAKTAAKVAENAAAQAMDPSEDLAAAAALLAACVSAVDQDTKGEEARREAWKEEYRDKAMTLVTSAVERGYPRSRLQEDPAWAALRELPAFQQLLREPR